MEKQSRGRNPSPKLCLSQTNGDDASRLVGGIVEKGFSDQLHSKGTPGFSISPPLPSVRPFPIARHRSHGPYWKPTIEDVNGDCEEVKNKMEEDDLKGLEKVGAFAKPVQRKYKKGLDFSSWREAADSISGFKMHKKEEDNDHYINSIERRNFTVQFVSADNLNGGLTSQDLTMPDKECQEQEQTVSVMAIDDQEVHMDVLPNGLNTLSENIQVDNREDLMSLEGQIDVENRALLAGMSADEILEARAEILAKLSPSRIEALRRHGLNKLKRQNFPSLDTHPICEKDNYQNEKSMMDTAVSSATVNPNPMSNGIPKEKESKLDGNIPNPLPTKTGLWDSWRKRVERVRELRFSMDGSIVGNDAKVPAKIADTVRSSSDYSLDNVAERDFLRTEGDPGAAGYTIKEAVALTRSVIPGQRTLALHLIASVINKAINGIFQNQLGHTLNYIVTDGSVDWEAIWAFALGPEPELALSLRICLDDNHKSVVLACAKVIQSVLTYDINESFFDIAERIPNYQADIPTAPVFRSRPEIDGGFLHGGFWKYSTKPSNILTSAHNSFANEPEDEHSIQDDITIAGQDIAAGLVRMGILQRICYLLEMGPSAPLEECSMSILIAIARHSPTCANAIMNCKSLVQVIVNRFVETDPMEINPSKIKSVTLLQILARFSKKNCLEFVKNGIFLKMTLHLYCNSSSLDQWIKRGREACKFSSALLVEQLRFWKVCIHYGYCVSHFSNLFPALCIWLTFPSFEKLIEQNVVNEYVMVAKEAFLVLGSLSKRLPNFYSHQMDAIKEDDETENWSWSNVGPLIDSSLEWIVIKNIPYISSLLQCQNDEKEYAVINSLMWLVSSVMHMLSGVLEAVIPPEDSTILVDGCLPWLPEFVPKIGSEIIKNGFFSFSGAIDGTYKVTRSFVECMCLLRLNAGLETSIASTCCLQGVIRAAIAVDKLISLPKCKILNASSICVKTLSPEDRVLSHGILQSCLSDLGHLMMSLVESIEHKWKPIHLVETFGRGGPAPGIGVGWGASGGGFWSKLVLSAEVDGLLIAHLLDILQIVSSENQLPTLNEEMICSVIQRINSTITTCLVVGPKGQCVIDKLFGILFQAPVLKSLDFITRRLIDLNKCLKPFEREYSKEEYQLYSNVLASHFRNRWLGSKKKPKPEISRSSLQTIPEEPDISSLVTPGPASLVVEWAHQRLPLPLHWFLSSLSTLPCSKNSSDSAGFLEVAKGGLLFLFGIEAASNFFGAGSSESSSGISGGPLLHVPIIWKLHALSILLLTGTGILEDGNCRAAYENLQGIYGQLLDAQDRTEVMSLNFQSEIHDGYSTFVETLVEQFAAVSYGDIIFGRQVAFYLLRSVEAPVRLATWRSLCIAFALELLPPLDKCISTADGYLEPVEDDERILEVYIKSWVSGSLDRASTRSSASFTIALHHLSTVIFKTCTHHTLPLRNKLARSLLRDYSRNQQHEGMMISLIQYEKPEACSRPKTDGEYISRLKCETENRLEKLREACEGNSSMLRVVEKLGSAIAKKHSW